MFKFIIATRRSSLALWQANYVKSRLQQYYPDWNIELLPLTTKGDQVLNTSLSEIGGKGLFLKELQQAVLEKRAHIAVHSLKDVPIAKTHQLIITAICEREDARDAFVSEEYICLNDLPKHAIVGTSSVRRTAQLLAWRSDLKIKPLRGNIETRLAKLKAKDYDAIILAAAGLIRLNKINYLREYLSVETFIPAVGQGALGIECLEEDQETQSFMSVLNHSTTAECIQAERAFSACLGGDCGTPLAAHAIKMGDHYQLIGKVASEDGKQILIGQRKGKYDPIKLGQELADELLKQGATKLLKKNN